jgi:hypothetical protein
MSRSSGIAGLTIDSRLFTALLDELARRGDGRRESGAFLLATREPIADSATDPTTVTALAYYDDLDPACLTGGITFGAEGYSALNALCRANALRVVGDIHTHPHSWVGQSDIDSSHPMVALAGHIALIAPNYALGPIAAADLGAHVFHPDGWAPHFGADVGAVLTITGRRHTDTTTARQRLRALTARLRRVIVFRRMT